MTVVPLGFRCSLAATMLLALTTVATAQKAISCTDFLHGRDGTWRSLVDGPLFGPNGAIPVANGALLRPTDRGPTGELARILNDLCEAH